MNNEMIDVLDSVEYEIAIQLSEIGNVAAEENLGGGDELYQIRLDIEKQLARLNAYIERQKNPF